MSETEVVAGIEMVLGKLLEEENQKRFKSWTKIIAFTFKDLERTWTTNLTSGVPSRLNEKPIDESTKYDIQVFTDSETWIGIIQKRIKAMNALTSGKLKIEGKMTDLIKLKRVI